jgi:hypothetical protein
MKSYIVDDRTGEVNQIGPFEAEDIYDAFDYLEKNTSFKKFKSSMETEIVDKTHGYITINLPGGARYEYEVGEVETEPATNAPHLEGTGAEQPEDENAERSEDRI